MSAPHSHFQFLGYRIVDFSLRLFADTIPAQPPQISFRHVVETLANEEDAQESSKMSCLVRMWVVPIWDDPQPLHLQVQVIGQFEAHPQMSPEDFERFADVLAPSLLYAQLRPVIHFMTAEAGVPLMMPLLNIAEAAKQRRQQREQAQQLELLDHSSEE